MVHLGVCPWVVLFQIAQRINFPHWPRIVAYAFLPDFGYHAMAETAIGDACSQLHWVFNEGAKSAGDGSAMVIWGALWS